MKKRWKKLASVVGMTTEEQYFVLARTRQRRITGQVDLLYSSEHSPVPPPKKSVASHNGDAGTVQATGVASCSLGWLSLGCGPYKKDDVKVVVVVVRESEGKRG